MRSLLAKIDRRLALGGVVLGASLTLLAVGLFSVFAAIHDGGADLPGQGSIEQIVGEGAQPGDLSVPGSVPDGPPPPAPTRLVIPRLYIDAPVITMGLDANRSPEVPDRPDQVAWYDFRAAPGQSSNAIFSGHVDWQTRSGQPIPGVFYRLRELEIGDVVTITLEDGATLTYRVTGNVATKYDDPNIVKAMNPTVRDVITIITCGGTWLKDNREKYGGVYSHRVVVRAERVIDTAAASEGVAGG